MRTQSTIRSLVAIVVVVFMMGFLVSCGSGATDGEEIAGDSAGADEGVADGDDSADDGIDLGKEVALVDLTVNGVDVLLSGFDSEYTVNEEIAVSATVRIGDTDAPWAGLLYIMIDHEGDVISENEFYLDFPSAGDYSQDFSFTPTELGIHTLQGAIFDSFWDLLGYYTAEFNVVPAGGSSIAEIDLTLDCAHGRFTLAGVEVILVDDNCDGLLEQYACGGGPLTDIAQDTTVLDCGLRISNGTPGRDRQDFRTMDINASQAPIPTIFAGGPENDSAKGSATDDLLLGGSHNDNLQGRQGNDTIACGSGNDYSKAESGNDKVFGGEGVDVIKGGTGNDEMHGGGGNDYVSGEGGDDLLYGEGGNDYVYDDSGNDRINCGDGDDVCKGGSGMDTISGGAGVDYCAGGPGSDVIDCGAGIDLVKGGSGSDQITACDDEADTIYGGSDNNTCTVDTGTDTAAECATITACL